MEGTFTKISEVLDSSVTLVVYTKLTQNLLNQEKTVLWNEEPLKVSKDTYEEFKEAIKKRGCKYYTRNDVIPYADFCTALLCASNYSLNHHSIPSIHERGFTAAWRGINIVCNTSSVEVSTWINSYISGRTPEGYDNNFKSDMLNTFRFTQNIREGHTGTVSEEDNEIVNSLSYNETINRVAYVGEEGCTVGLFRTSSTPESQLDMLKSIKVYTDAICNL